MIWDVHLSGRAREGAAVRNSGVSRWNWTRRGKEEGREGGKGWNRLTAVLADGKAGRKEGQ